jgi:ATP-dependent Lon protease
MTGEITLRGEITPIGGLKEKMLAALRGGIKTVIIPNDNERELSEVPEKIKGKLGNKNSSRVEAMALNNIKFSACQNTMRGFKKRTGHLRKVKKIITHSIK